MRYWKLPTLKHVHGGKPWTAGDLALSLILAREEWRESIDTVRRHGEVYDLLVDSPPAGTVIELQDAAHEMLVRIGRLPGVSLGEPAQNRDYMRLYESILIADKEAPAAAPPLPAAATP